jgi:cytochrome oxidase Cu insertion factor (SCO1/SenC/PrrC family)
MMRPQRHSFKTGSGRATFRDTGGQVSSPQPSVGAPATSPSLRRLRFVAWGAVAVGAALGVLLFFVLRSSPSAAPAAAAPGAEPPAATWAAGTRPAPDFRLVDQGGRPVSISAFHGRPVIVTFIDPLCRNYCPLEAKQLNAVVRSLPAASRPAIVAVSVNVYGNARSNLLQDVARWQLVPEWHWAVGSRAALARVWRQYQIGVLVTTRTIAGVTVHEISHTEGAYVIDRSGDVRALFLWPFASSDVRATLKSLAA